jgi:TonB family protein
MSRCSIFILLAILLAGFRLAPAQDSDAAAHSRAVVRRVAPVYPDLARRMSITGAVKIIVTVAPNGSVRSIEPVGGNPILIKAVQEAVVNWKYSAGATQTKEFVELRFSAH